MDYRTELLIKHGFIEKRAKENNYTFDEDKKIWIPKEGYTSKEEDANEEWEEVSLLDRPLNFARTGFPQTKKTYHLLWEVYDLAIEEPYYWILRDLQSYFKMVEKLEDSFAAAENSAFFGITQVRLGGQQEKVSQFLATTGKMIKELFQMVRELRIIDERMEYYEETEQQLKISEPQKRSKSAEITLKGFFVDLVQGGGKNPASIFGMARELEFVTLPDLFFDAPPFKSTEELDAHLKSLEKDFNQAVLRVLQRHLRNYMEWKKRTYSEHISRRRFMLQYLLQHFEIIKMYIVWVKPYLRHVARLTMKEKNLTSPEVITAFESSMLDIEILARSPHEIDGRGYNSCCLATFNYRTRPDMKVVQEGYQRGPVHVGKFEMWMRQYMWTDEQVEAYKRLKDEEGLALLGDVSDSVRKAMESLGEELDRYLGEARGSERKREAEKPEEKTFMQKFFGDFYTPKHVKAKRPKKEKKKSKLAQADIDEELKEILDRSKWMCWQIYKNFKKAHKLIQF